MATRLFKIGENARYGKWRLTTRDGIVLAEGIDWSTNKVIEKTTFPNIERDKGRQLRNYLEGVTTSYFAGKMMDWVRLTVPEVSPW